MINGCLVWTTIKENEGKASHVERTWFLAKAGGTEDPITQALSKCHTAILHLSCSYPAAVMDALRRRV